MNNTAVNCLPKRGRWMAGLLAAALLSQTAMAAGRTPAPDWSGMYRLKGSPATIDGSSNKIFQKGTLDKAPLKPEYQADYEAMALRSTKQGDPNAQDSITDTNTLNCFAGFPRLISNPYGFVFFITPTKTWIIMDKAVRQILTDGRDWPPQDAQWPLMLGRSLGHWEGDTLVVETRNMRSDMWLDPTAMMLSDKAVVFERLRKIDTNTIENQVTIQDPVKFTADWKFTRDYVKQPENKDDWPDDPELCGGAYDRNPIVNGKVTVKLPN